MRILHLYGDLSQRDKTDRTWHTLTLIPVYSGRPDSAIVNLGPERRPTELSDRIRDAVRVRHWEASDDAQSQPDELNHRRSESAGKGSESFSVLCVSLWRESLV